MDTSVELLLFASPEIGHLLAEVELGRRLIALNPNLSVAILVPQYPTPNPTVDSSIRSLHSSLRLDPTTLRIDLLLLPPLQNLPPNWSSLNHIAIIDLLANLYKPIVIQISNSRPIRTAGILFDMFGAPMIDVADDLEIPSYLFYTSGANMLTFQFTLSSLNSPDLGLQFESNSPESTPVNILGFKNPVPKKVWPVVLLHKDWSPIMISFVKEYKRAKGILVNTFEELDSDLLRALGEMSGIPPVYSVGPILHLDRVKSGSDRDPVLRWLDDQPKGSVVFLCFGSKVGSFEKKQVEQLAAGLERSGHRFLWSLRASSLEEILPEGFLERTSGVGKVIGWAPQTDILAHEAVGAFVSHCGWNSTLESIWYGVPLVTWPMYAEQQLNAFLLTTELGLAVNLSMDYNFDMKEGKGNVVVDAAEVEGAIRRVMEEEEGAVVRRKVKEVSEVARKAVEVGGSSTVSLARFVEEVFKNLGS